MKSPSTKQIRSARNKAGMTQTNAALVVYTTLRTWQNWETTVGKGNHRSMPLSIFHLFLLKTGQITLNDIK